MIKCICVASDREKRETIEGMLNKISQLTLEASCSGMKAVLKRCQSKDIDLVFVSLNLTPVANDKISLLKEISKCGAQIIVLTSKVNIARQALKANITNYVIFPTSSRMLWKASIQALKLNDLVVYIPPVENRCSGDSKNSFTR